MICKYCPVTLTCVCLFARLHACRSDLTCCEQPDRHEQHAMFLPEADPGPTVGRCSITTSLVLAPAVISPNMVFAFNINLDCQLAGEADICGPSGCSEVVVSGQGEGYLVENVVLDGPLAEFAPDSPFCYDSSNKKQGASLDDTLLGNMRALRAGLNTTRSAKRAARAGSGTGAKQGTRDDTVYVAQLVLVVSLPVTITSRTHHPKWERGWVEFMVADGIDIQTAVEVAANEAAKGVTFPRASVDDFNKYKFQLFRKEQGY